MSESTNKILKEIRDGSGDGSGGVFILHRTIEYLGDGTHKSILDISFDDLKDMAYKKPIYIETVGDIDYDDEETIPVTITQLTLVNRMGFYDSEDPAYTYVTLDYTDYYPDGDVISSLEDTK